MCRELDGRIFKLSEAKTGVNLPPMHPFCRSTALAVLPDEDELDRELAELEEEIGADVDFEKWKASLQKQPDGKLKYVRPVDKSGESGIIKEKEDLRGYIGQPITETDNQHIREWYYANVSDIPNQINRDKSFIEQVHEAFDLRNKYKRQARIAMTDIETVEELEKKRPVPEFEELVESKMKRKGMTKQEALEDILETASKTNPDVNKEFGL